MRFNYARVMITASPFLPLVCYFPCTPTLVSLSVDIKGLETLHVEHIVRYSYSCMSGLLRLQVIHQSSLGPFTGNFKIYRSKEIRTIKLYVCIESWRMVVLASSISTSVLPFDRMRSSPFVNNVVSLIKHTDRPQLFS